MNMNAARSCLGWEGINNRKQAAHFTTVQGTRHSSIVYTHLEPTNGDSSDSNEF
jgi:hypothetical protein